MNLNPIFSSFFVHEMLNIDNERIKSFCYKQKETDLGVSISNVGGWHSNILNINHPELEPLSTIVCDRFEQVNKHIDFGNEIEPNGCWININNRGNYNKRHDHKGNFLSAVYYVNAAPDMGEIVFHNPYHVLEWFQNTDKVNTFNQFNSSTWNMPCRTGLLLIFPAWLEHEVSSNPTDHDRISIAFNMKRISE